MRGSSSFAALLAPFAVAVLIALPVITRGDDASGISDPLSGLGVAPAATGRDAIHAPGGDAEFSAVAQAKAPADTDAAADHAALATQGKFWGRRRAAEAAGGGIIPPKMSNPALHERLVNAEKRIGALEKKRGKKTTRRRRRTIRRRRRKTTRRKRGKKWRGRKKGGRAKRRRRRRRKGKKGKKKSLNARIRDAVRRVLAAKRRLRKAGSKLGRNKALEAEYKKYCKSKTCKALWLRFRAAQKKFIAKHKIHRAATIRGRRALRRSCKRLRKWKKRRSCRKARTAARKDISLKKNSKRIAHKHKSAAYKAYRARLDREKKRWSKGRAVGAKAKKGAAGVKCKKGNHTCVKAQALRRIAIAKMRKANALRRIAAVKKLQSERKAKERKVRAKKRAKAKKVAKRKATLRKRRLAIRRKRMLVKKRKAKIAAKRAAKARARKRRAARRLARARARALAAREKVNQKKVAAMIRKIFHWRGKIPKLLTKGSPEDLSKVVRYLKGNLGWSPVVNRKGKKPLTPLEKQRIVNYYKYYLSFSGGVGPWW